MNEMWIGGSQPSGEDCIFLNKIKESGETPLANSHPNTFAWLCLISKFSISRMSTFPGYKAPVVKEEAEQQKPKEEEDLQKTQNQPRDPVDPDQARSIPFPELKFKQMSDSDKSGLKINVMSYNVLAYGNDTPSEFTYASKENLNFNYRAPRIIKEIKDANADILCL